MKTGIIIQARKGSTRLPNKIVLPFYKGKGVLELLIEKLILEFPKNQIILATTTNKRDEELVTIAKRYAINFFQGSENNVLNRFIETAKIFHFKNIIRVCADNPFLDIIHIHNLIEELEKNHWDYVSYKTKNGLPTIKSHLGLFTEGVSVGALQKVGMLTNQLFYKEHVTNFIYENDKDFSIKLFELPPYLNNINNIRLTLDTMEDFKIYQRIYTDLMSHSIEGIVQFIKENKELTNRMIQEISRHTK